MPPASAYRFHAPGLNLLLAWSWQPAWHRAWLRLTLPSLLALWFYCLPGLHCLEHENKRSQPRFLCRCLLSYWVWLCFGYGALNGLDLVRVLQSSRWEDIPNKDGCALAWFFCMRGDPKTAVGTGAPPCFHTAHQIALTYLGEAPPPTCTPEGPGIHPSRSHALEIHSWAQHNWS